MTAEEIDRLPPRIKCLLREDHHSWRTERNWMAAVGTEANAADSISLKLLLNDANINTVEASFASKCTKV